VLSAWGKCGVSVWGTTKTRPVGPLAQGLSGPMAFEDEASLVVLRDRAEQDPGQRTLTLIHGGKTIRLDASAIRGGGGPRQSGRRGRAGGIACRLDDFGSL